MNTIKPGDTGHAPGDPAPEWGFSHSGGEDGQPFEEWPECDVCQGAVRHTGEVDGVILASDVAFHV